MRSLVKVLAFIIAAGASFGLWGCKSHSEKRTLPPPEVTVTIPVEKEVTRNLEYTGTTAALEYVEIRARVTGFLEKICFQPRAKVKTDQLLFVIDPRQYQAQVDENQAKVAAQKASLKLAQTELQSSEQLETQRAISPLRLEQQSAKRDMARADVELAEAALVKSKLDLEWTKVTSPINGRVSRNLVDAGNLVGLADKTLLTTVINDETIYVYFNISELDALPLIRQRAAEREQSLEERKLPVFLALADEKNYAHEGYLDFADTKVDSSTGTLQIRGVFKNPNELLMAGMFVRVRVPIEKKQAKLVPEIAVLADQGGSFVLVLDKDDKVEHRRIVKGIADNGLQVVEKGLKGDERVIVLGMQRVRPGVKVKATMQTPPAAAPQDTPKEK